MTAERPDGPSERVQALLCLLSVFANGAKKLGDPGIVNAFAQAVQLLGVTDAELREADDLFALSLSMNHDDWCDLVFGGHAEVG